MGGQITRNTLYDSLGGPFPGSAQCCPPKARRCGELQQCGGLSACPLLFHPSAKGSQILIDRSQRSVKRQASFCNAITFSHRPIRLYEQVRLKITKKQCCWSGALRLGFTAKDPSRIHPDSLPKYACPDLVSQYGFWAKALPEEQCSEGTVVAFWLDRKGRVFYRINGSSPMLFFSGVQAAEPVWALIDVYGLTRGVQLLDSEMVPLECVRPRSLRREADELHLSVSLCELRLQEEHLSSTSCTVPQNSQNSRQSSVLPALLDGDLHFHRLHGNSLRAPDAHTVCHLDNGHGEERTLVFTHRPLRAGETVFLKVGVRSPAAARYAALSCGVTSCDPAGLRPSDLPISPEALVDRKEFWAVCRVTTPLQGGDVLGCQVTVEGEVLLSHNGSGAVRQLCVDNSRPLWMLFSLHGALTQLSILGSTQQADPWGSSAPSSPCCSALCNSDPNISNLNNSCHSNSNNTPNISVGVGSYSTSHTSISNSLNSNSSYPAPHNSSAGTVPSSPASRPDSPSFPSCRASWSDECTICYENEVDTVLYACGHMCLCYACGLRLKRMTNACCPICRRAIKDIIKTYRSA